MESTITELDVIQVRQQMARDIIANIRRERAEWYRQYRADHPRARYVSDYIAGAGQALESAAQDICRQYIGHEYADTEKPPRKECSVCGAIQMVDA